ncbi:hypothetical protein RUND412_009634 [Rhizina undulata]
MTTSTSSHNRRNGVAVTPLQFSSPDATNKAPSHRPTRQRVLPRPQSEPKSLKISPFGVVVGKRPRDASANGRTGNVPAPASAVVGRKRSLSASEIKWSSLEEIEDVGGGFQLRMEYRAPAVVGGRKGSGIGRGGDKDKDKDKDKDIKEKEKDSRTKTIRRSSKSIPATRSGRWEDEVLAWEKSRGKKAESGRQRCGGGVVGDRSSGTTLRNSGYVSVLESGAEGIGLASSRDKNAAVAGGGIDAGVGKEGKGGKDVKSRASYGSVTNESFRTAAETLEVYNGAVIAAELLSRLPGDAVEGIRWANGFGKRGSLDTPAAATVQAPYKPVSKIPSARKLDKGKGVERIPPPRSTSGSAPPSNVSPTSPNPPSHPTSPGLSTTSPLSDRPQNFSYPTTFSLPTDHTRHSIADSLRSVPAPPATLSDPENWWSYFYRHSPPPSSPSPPYPPHPPINPYPRKRNFSLESVNARAAGNARSRWSMDVETSTLHEAPVEPEQRVKTEVRRKRRRFRHFRGRVKDVAEKVWVVVEMVGVVVVWVLGCCGGCRWVGGRVLWMLE